MMPLVYIYNIIPEVHEFKRLMYLGLFVLSTMYGLYKIVQSVRDEFF